MSFNLSDLPPRAQEQVLRKIKEEDQQKYISNDIVPKKPETKKTEKYRSKKVTNEEGITFRSKREEERYNELMNLLSLGLISELKLEPQFTLLEGYKKPDGTRVKRLHYTADFSYIENGMLVVEDVKSNPTKTEAYGIRKTLMKDRYGIDIKEIF